MSGPQAALLGDRLHLQHGPIDLIIGADGARQIAFEAARARFETLLQDLMSEIELLRAPVDASLVPQGETARRMHAAAMRFDGFVTPMAGVAGAVAETVLDAMLAAGDLDRAYVNNGGDIALHLAPDQRFAIAVSDHKGRSCGQVDLRHVDPVRGIATSGRHGRSHSMGIADSVTVLAQSASIADVAATLIANATDLPGHPEIQRIPAVEHDENSDLGERLIVTHCGPLTNTETRMALANGLQTAQTFCQAGHIAGALLCLNGQVQSLGNDLFQARTKAHQLQGQLEHA